VLLQVCGVIHSSMRSAEAGAQGLADSRHWPLCRRQLGGADHAQRAAHATTCPWWLRALSRALLPRQAGYHSSAVGAIRQVAFQKAGERRAFFEQLIALDEAEHRQCAPASHAPHAAA
jgi:hypothetical protein